MRGQAQNLWSSSYEPAHRSQSRLAEIYSFCEASITARAFKVTTRVCHAQGPHTSLSELPLFVRRRPLVGQLSPSVREKIRRVLSRGRGTGLDVNLDAIAAWGEVSVVILTQVCDLHVLSVPSLAAVPGFQETGR